MLEIGCSAWQDPRGKGPGIHNIMGTVLTRSCQGLRLFVRLQTHPSIEGFGKSSAPGEGGEKGKKREGSTGGLRNPSCESRRGL